MHARVERSLKAWLEEFASCVRNRDFERGRDMFLEEVVGYGTWTDRMVGLDNLVVSQWCNVWPKTEGFTFDWDSSNVWCDHPSAPKLAVIAALWSGNGVDGSGGHFDRKGRSTTVLQKDAADRWRAVHTHFSLLPNNNLTGSA